MGYGTKNVVFYNMLNVMACIVLISNVQTIGDINKLNRSL
jgi:hypothetical protein